MSVKIHSLCGAINFRSVNCRAVSIQTPHRVS